MRIFCNGCSYTYGVELKDPEKSRYSTLLGQMFDAEVVNIAKRGSSLHRLLRSTYERCDPTKYDLAVLQFTFPARTEFYISGLSDNRESCFVRPRPSHILNKDDILYYVDNSKYAFNNIVNIKDEFLSYKRSYYATAYTEELGFTFEYMVFQALQDYFARHDVPVITTTLNNDSVLPFHLKYNTSDLPRAKYGHPNEMGHKIFAEKLEDIIKQGNYSIPDAKKSHLNRLKRDHKKILRHTDYTDYI